MVTPRKVGLAAGSVDYGSGAVTAATKCAKANDAAVDTETNAAKAEYGVVTAVSALVLTYHKCATHL